MEVAVPGTPLAALSLRRALPRQGRLLTCLQGGAGIGSGEHRQGRGVRHGLDPNLLAEDLHIGSGRRFGRRPKYIPDTTVS